MSTVGIISYRLGGVDGVSVEAEKWARAFARLGFEVTRIAGSGSTGSSGPPIELVAGLGIDDTGPVDIDALRRALDGLDVVVVENLCSLPLNPNAGEAVATALRGRPAIMRHHDLAWHREDTSRLSGPPDDPAWIHATINKRNVSELAERGIAATCLYNRFEMEPSLGDRDATRRALGISANTFLVLQPTRALPRKNVPGGLSLAEHLGASYWLTAAAEDGFGPELDRILAGATVPILRGQGPGSIDDAYGASDLVVLPSTWEGFGNPAIEAVTHQRPLALGHYPVAEEIRSFGFAFFDPEDPEPIATWLANPDKEIIEKNLSIARAHFDIDELPQELDALLDRLGIISPGSNGDR